MTADTTEPRKRNKKTRGRKEASSNKDQATRNSQLCKIITRLSIQTKVLRLNHTTTIGTTLNPGA
jgi:hypothetical protein